jgi:hypothetical protein
MCVGKERDRYSCVVPFILTGMNLYRYYYT